MTFKWIDARGELHELTECQPIIDEVEAISGDIDGFLVLVSDDNADVRDPARNAIRKAHARLGRLSSDLEHWDRHVESQTRRAAAELVSAIDALPAAIGKVALVVALHDEQNELVEHTGGDPDARQTALEEPMTSAQRRAIAACDSRTPPKDTANRAEAKAWLDAQPQFSRAAGGVDGGWFAWTDRHHHAHRIADPLPIEREVIAVANELIGSRAALANVSDPHDLYQTVTQASVLLERLKLLQGDLDRFDQESEAREISAWSKYAADWRSKRMKR